MSCDGIMGYRYPPPLRSILPCESSLEGRCSARSRRRRRANQGRRVRARARRGADAFARVSADSWRGAEGSGEPRAVLAAVPRSGDTRVAPARLSSPSVRSSAPRNLSGADSRDAAGITYRQYSRRPSIWLLFTRTAVRARAGSPAGAGSETARSAAVSSATFGNEPSAARRYTVIRLRSGSTSQYSRTPLRSKSRRLICSSRLRVPGERISITSAGAPCTFFSVRMSC